MKQEIVQIITATIGSLGFSIYFRVSEKNVIASTAGGAIGWIVYLIAFRVSENQFVSNFTAALVVYLFAELMARILKAPSNVFLVPGIIPLIPGSALYYTMYGIVDSNHNMFTENASKTAVITMGIAAGIIVGAVIMIYFMNLQKNFSQKKKDK